MIIAENDDPSIVVHAETLFPPVAVCIVVRPACQRDNPDLCFVEFYSNIDDCSHGRVRKLAIVPSQLIADFLNNCK